MGKTTAPVEPNRKTNIPVKGIPGIVEWLLKFCTKDELLFMASLAGNRRNFALMASILTKLTDRNIHEVFYDSTNMTAEQLMVFRAGKRGEVAGLKAFQLACQTAREELLSRKEDAD